MSSYTSRGKEWKALREKILKRDNFTCGYCGGEATQVDHIIAVSKGGSNDESNLISACARCNRLKSDKALMRTQWVNPKYSTHIKTRT